jgi:hypothetical protein
MTKREGCLPVLVARSALRLSKASEVHAAVKWLTQLRRKLRDVCHRLRMSFLMRTIGWEPPHPPGGEGATGFTSHRESWASTELVIWRSPVHAVVGGFYVRQQYRVESF